MTNQYLDTIKQREMQSTEGKQLTAYQKDYNNCVKKDRAWIDEMNYPLYGQSVASISFWNATEAIHNKPFQQYHPLTKVNAECLDFQFR